MMNLLLTILIGIGYIFLLIGYGQKGIDARKEQGKSGLDGCVCILLTVAVIFWAVKLVLWLRDGAPDNGDKGLIIGMAAAYILWCVYARISVKRYTRKPKTAPVRTASASENTANQSNNNLFNKGDSGKTGSAIPGSTNFATGASIPGSTGSSGSSGIPGVPKFPGGHTAVDAPEDVPLDRDMGLGGHHISANCGHFGMSVSYIAATHTVEFHEWSSQEPEKTEVYQIPAQIRTRASLLDYLRRNTPIPGVCFMHD